MRHTHVCKCYGFRRALKLVGSRNDFSQGTIPIRVCPGVRKLGILVPACSGRGRTAAADRGRTTVVGLGCTTVVCLGRTTVPGHRMLNLWIPDVRTDTAVGCMVTDPPPGDGPPSWNLSDGCTCRPALSDENTGTAELLVVRTSAAASSDRRGTSAVTAGP